MNKLKNRLKNWSLGTKMLVYFLSMFIVIMAALGAITITNVNVKTGTLTNDLTEQVVLARADEIGKYMQDLINEVTLWSQRDKIMTGDMVTIKSDLASRQGGLRSDFEMVLYADTAGNAITSTGSAVNIADREYFKAIIEEGKDSAISAPIISKSSGKLVFVVAHVVRDGAKKTIGIFGATVLLDTLDVVRDSIRIGQAGYAWIIDGTGLIIAHPDENIRMQLNILNADEAGIAGGNALGTQMLANGQGLGEIVKNGAKYYVTYAPIPNTPGWIMAYSMQEADMMQTVNSLSVLIAIIVAGSLLTVAVLTILLSASIVKPVKSAAALAKELASGNLDYSAAVRSNDEVGKLTTILDCEVRTAFKDIERARMVSEKQAQYQSNEVGKLLVNLERLSQGELNCDIVVGEADEDTKELYDLFGKIAWNLSDAVYAIKGYIAEISETLGEMASGNLTVSIGSEYKGDFIELKKSINSIAQSLNSTMLDISTAAQQVAAGTVQLSAGSQTISQGATEQASAIEELSATITQIAAQIRDSASKNTVAMELSEQAQKESVKGNEQMQSLQQAMTAIDKSSKDISKIIKVIDNIAFQTNILALNAAVEAARAGSQGRGFAVVAEEVRNLANRSAQAAKETTELINDSIRKVDDGTKLTAVTGESLTSILDGAVYSAQLMSEIAAAANEQATGIAQINNGIDQLSQVVQMNSATAQQAAAASEELSSQADLLKSMVAQFKLAGGVQDASAGEPETKRTTVKKAPPEKPHKRIVLSDSEFDKY